ncbi:MAG: HAMP domain-containing histidine kinase [Bacteriovoracaceae bacterium]|nr:HAMP domain-containing histidine kinase [Bacteriovoracaceae bacterium]
MENRSHPSNQETSEYVKLFIDPQILLDFDSLDTAFFTLTPASEAKVSLLKRGDRLWVNFADGEHCDFPYYLKNIRTLLDGMRLDHSIKAITTEAFDGFIKTTQGIEKKVFSRVSLSPGENVKDLWDEIIKKVNLISSESHSLRSLMEKLLDVPFLQKFESSLIVLHLKGQTKAELLGIIWRSEKTQSLIEVKDFNSFFNSIKKSKIKSFSSETFSKMNLPFNGSFLAKEIMSKKYSMVAIVSRHDFLNYSKDEVELFETCIDLLQPHFERLIDQEFSDKRISELRVCLKDFPLPLRIKDGVTGASFLNDLYTSELQDKDIFFNKKVQGPFTIDLYDSDELRHYAFDLFHFQRISLLGELLNTLRHELSNPLFGLKLGSQLFSMMDVNSDSKELMHEIEKNINRCQVIIENFSNLYQVQSENKPVSIKKIIDEAIVLSKSEGREVRKSIVFQNNTQEVLLDVPLIFVVQIIFNLIVNAAQAMKAQPQPQELKLIIDAEDQMVHIDIIDNGPGISQDKISQLFKPFFTTKPQGTGLGLVLSRNLALKMGGNLEYLVNNSDKGAHFRLTLPKT